MLLTLLAWLSSQAAEPTHGPFAPPRPLLWSKQRLAVVPGSDGGARLVLRDPSGVVVLDAAMDAGQVDLALRTLERVRPSVPVGVGGSAGPTGLALSMDGLVLEVRADAAGKPQEVHIRGPGLGMGVFLAGTEDIGALRDALGRALRPPRPTPPAPAATSRPR